MKDRSVTQPFPAALRYRASGVILNPWYQYPVSMTVGPGLEPREDAPEISSPRVMQVPEIDLAILVEPRDLAFIATSADQRGLIHVEALRQYTMYRTFLNFNHESVPPALGRLPAQADALQFTVRRVVRNETTTDGGVAIHHTDTPETIRVEASDVRRFLKAWDPPLGYAIGLYLRTEDPRYVLVEYYKAVEWLAKALGGFAKMVKTLKPYGVTEAGRRKFTTLCNDQNQRPTDIGRHAANPGVPFRVVDFSDAFSDLRFMADFEQATTFCRCVIDGYVAYRAG